MREIAIFLGLIGLFALVMIPVSMSRTTDLKENAKPFTGTVTGVTFRHRPKPSGAGHESWWEVGVRFVDPHTGQERESYDIVQGSRSEPMAENYPTGSKVNGFAMPGEDLVLLRDDVGGPDNTVTMMAIVGALFLSLSGLFWWLHSRG